MKGAPVHYGVIEACHYNSSEIPLRQMNELPICHALKLTGRKGPPLPLNHSDFAFNALMNICKGTTAHLFVYIERLRENYFMVR